MRTVFGRSKAVGLLVVALAAGVAWFGSVAAQPHPIPPPVSPAAYTPQPPAMLPPPTDGSGARIISVLVEAVGGTAADPTYSSYVVASAPSA